MTDLRTAAQQALDVLENAYMVNSWAWVDKKKQAVAALKAALAEEALQRLTDVQQEMERNFCPRCGKRTNDIHTCTPPDSKHATIKQHKPLTTEEVEQLWAQSSWQGRANIGFARAIEKAHGIGV